MSLLSTMATVLAFLFAGILAAAFILMGVFLYVGYSRMEEILGHLENCQAIQQRRFLMHVGPWGTVMLTASIAGIMTFPGVYLRHGGVSQADLDAFPSTLKRKLILLHIVNIALVVAGVLVGGAMVVCWNYVKRRPLRPRGSDCVSSCDHGRIGRHLDTPRRVRPALTYRTPDISKTMGWT